MIKKSKKTKKDFEVVNIEEKKILEVFPNITDEQIYFIEDLKDKYFQKGLKYGKNI